MDRYRGGYRWRCGEEFQRGKVRGMGKEQMSETERERRDEGLLTPCLLRSLRQMGAH